MTWSSGVSITYRCNSFMGKFLFMSNFFWQKKRSFFFFWNIWGGGNCGLSSKEIKVDLRGYIRRIWFQTPTQEFFLKNANFDGDISLWVIQAVFLPSSFYGKVYKLVFSILLERNFALGWLRYRKNISF